MGSGLTCMKRVSPWVLTMGTRGSTSRDTDTSCVMKLAALFTGCWQ